MNTNKLKSIDALKRIGNSLKEKKKIIVTTNGVFDILHIGHVRYLQKAKSLGDVLIVGINSDSSVKKIKGPKRPINNQQYRAEVLSALECVDYVLIFEEDTPIEWLKVVKPDIHVKGGDYKIDGLSYHKSVTGGKTNLEKMRGGRASDSERVCSQSQIGGSPEHFDKIIERDVVVKNGGKIVILDKVNGVSTSELIEKIKRIVKEELAIRKLSFKINTKLKKLREIYLTFYI